jgi:lipopolysaccharide biosynthesis protein
MMTLEKRYTERDKQWYIVHKDLGHLAHYEEDGITYAARFDTEEKADSILAMLEPGTVMENQCSYCGGNGKFPPDTPCPVCKGTGRA